MRVWKKARKRCKAPFVPKTCCAFCRLPSLLLFLVPFCFCLTSTGRHKRKQQKDLVFYAPFFLFMRNVCRCSCCRCSPGPELNCYSGILMHHVMFLNFQAVTKASSRVTSRRRNMTPAMDTSRCHGQLQGIAIIIDPKSTSRTCWPTGMLNYYYSDVVARVPVKNNEGSDTTMQDAGLSFFLHVAYPEK